MNSIYLSAPKILSINDRYFNKEPIQRFRNDFAKDRDRILYSKAFRRLSGKTQVFMYSGNKDIRTRLTHTLEVNQIAKTIAVALASNLELTEAIALGHDIGHTPFGHVGKRSLSYIMNGCELIIDGVTIKDNNRGFKHNLQALRILCDLEGLNPGLNISKYTLWGIANHSGLIYKDCVKTKKGVCYNTHKSQECSKTTTQCSFYDKYLDGIDRDKYWSVEGFIVAIADEIAQRHHDIEDSLRNDIIDRDELLEKLTDFKTTFTKEDKKNFKDLSSAKKKDLEEFVSLFSRLIVNYYVNAIIKQTKENIKDFGVKYEIKKSADFNKVQDNFRKILSL